MTDLSAYHDLIERKRVAFSPRGFSDYGEIKGELFAHQMHGVEFALRAGCAAHFYDTGLGKSRMAMAWAQKIIERTNRPVLMLAPLAVTAQHLVEAQAFGVEAVPSRFGVAPAKPCIAITNYERLDRFDPADYAAVVLDESSILKSYAGATSRKIIETFQLTPFRLACSATPAPNDHMEIGQQCEFLGVMDQSLMLQRWFINDTKTASKNWRLKKHAAASFWDWVASWARCVTKPSDLGFSDAGFEMPKLNIHRHIIEADRSTDTGEEKRGKHEGQMRLFRMPDTSATSIHREKRLTVEMRAAKVAEIIAREPDEPWVIWCDTDYEEDALTAAISNATPIRGSMTIDMKEDRLHAFTIGEIKRLVVKPRIAGFGLNWQHCARTAYIGLSFSYEQFYQTVRRFWRFRQKRDVDAHIVCADTEVAIMEAVNRKQAGHDEMKAEMIDAMRRTVGLVSRSQYTPTKNVTVPGWIQ